MSNDLVARLQSLQKKKQDEEQKYNRLQGQRDALLARLSKDFGCKTLEEAEKKLASLQANVEKREARLAQMLDEIETKVAEHES